METAEIRNRLLTLLAAIAPDIEPAAVNPDIDLRDQFDFDSMDALHLATAIGESFGIDIAQTDYPKLASVSAASEYVRGKLAPKQG